jgi:E3 ubiquitin-protein ligase SIAH1
MEISCPNEKHGCRETISYCRNRKHEEECIHEPCYCPLSGCDFVASSEVLSSHFSHKHGDSRNKFSYGHSFVVSLNSNDETVVLQEKNDGKLFILKNITMLLGTAVNICCIGPKSSESKYSYNILAWSQMSELEFHTFAKNVRRVSLKTLSSEFLVIPFGFSEPLEIEICIRSVPCDSMVPPISFSLLCFFPLLNSSIIDYCVGNCGADANIHKDPGWKGAPLEG